MLLYAIAGAYQPAVQASLPLLLPPDRLTQGNAVINMVAKWRMALPNREMICPMTTRVKSRVNRALLAKICEASEVLQT